MTKKINLIREIKSLKLILLSSGARRGEAEQARRVSIDDYLSKPFRQEELLRCLRTLMAGNKAETGSNSPVTRHTLGEEAARRNDSVETTTEIPNQNAKSARILIVEDNPVNQMVAKTQLKKFGYRTDVAGNGVEALDAISRIPYDLVLMDCQMPVMDGYEATAEIRSREKTGARRVPVIAMTAHAIEGEREKCLAAGMDDYLSKPVQKDALRQTVELWLSAASDSAKLNLEPAATAEFQYETALN